MADDRMSTEVRIVAPHFTPATSRPGSHFVTHAAELAVGFRSIGASCTLLAPEGPEASDPHCRAVLATSTPRSTIDSLGDFLVGSTAGVSLLYDGGLRYLEPLCDLAGRFPEERFILNLLDRDPGLTLESLSRVEHRIRLSRRRHDYGGRTSGILPTNVVLTGDTPKRTVLARGMGLPVDGSWHLHSQLAAFAGDFRPGPNEHDPNHLRILLPLSTWNAAPSLQEIGFAVLRTPELLDPDQKVSWTLSGNLDRIIGSPVLRRLDRAGVAIEHRARPLHEFADLFRAHDLVWLPMRRDCETQSSGKAADALAIGRPIIAPAGSYAAQEQARWLPPDLPDYRKVEEVPVLIAAMFRLMPSASARFAATAEARARHFSPEASAAHVLDLAEQATPDRGGRPFDIPTGAAEDPAPPSGSERWRLRARALRVGARTRRLFPEAHRA